MDCEQRGHCAPHPVTVCISESELRIEKHIARERAQYRGYAGKESRWKRGLVGTDRAILSGMIGQYAAGLYLGVPSDESSKPDGDGGIDLEWKGLTIQVKTRLKPRANSLVRRVTDRKRVCPIKAEVMLFCQLIDDRTVLLLGWIRSRDGRRVASFKRSPVAEHWNMVIADADLLPVSQLKQEIALR
jgi:hypothetical protein